MILLSILWKTSSLSALRLPLQTDTCNTTASTCQRMFKEPHLSMTSNSSQVSLTPWPVNPSMTNMFQTLKPRRNPFTILSSIQVEFNGRLSAIRMEMTTQLDKKSMTLSAPSKNKQVIRNSMWGTPLYGYPFLQEWAWSQQVPSFSKWANSSRRRSISPW